LPKDILDMLVFHSQMENVQSCFHPYQWSQLQYDDDVVVGNVED
jgi:hypothetical protein